MSFKKAETHFIDYSSEVNTKVIAWHIRLNTKTQRRVVKTIEIFQYGFGPVLGTLGYVCRKLTTVCLSLKNCVLLIIIVLKLG